MSLWHPNTLQPCPVATGLSTAMITAELPGQDSVSKQRQLLRSMTVWYGDDIFDVDADSNEAVSCLAVAKKRFHAELLDRYQIEAPIFIYEGKLYVRASCYIYNSKDDVEALGQAVLDICSRWYGASMEAKL